MKRFSKEHARHTSREPPRLVDGLVLEEREQQVDVLANESAVGFEEYQVMPAMPTPSRTPYALRACPRSRCRCSTRAARRC